jgi:hypothetical protein
MQADGAVSRKFRLLKVRKWGDIYKHSLSGIIPPKDDVMLSGVEA